MLKGKFPALVHHVPQAGSFLREEVKILTKMYYPIEKFRKKGYNYNRLKFWLYLKFL